MKPTLYFIPGTMCDSLIWSHIWPALKPDFDLVYLPIPSETELSALLSSLLATLNEAQAPVNLIGFSMGGYLATCLAEHNPSLIKRVLVLSNSPCRLPEAELRQRQQTLNWLTKFQYSGITEQKINQLLAKHNQHNAEIIALIKTMEQNLGYEQLLTQLTATSNRDDKSKFIAQCATHFTFCYGDEDKLIDRQWMKQLAAHQHINSKMLNNCGHMLPLEQPTQLIELIRNTFD